MADGSPPDGFVYRESIDDLLKRAKQVRAETRRLLAERARLKFQLRARRDELRRIDIIPFPDPPNPR